MEYHNTCKEIELKQYTGISADDVWRMAVADLFESPEHVGLTRGGDTLESLQCTLSIIDPRQRWVLSRKPVWNPAFGLVELIWILNGEDDSDVLRFWNPKLQEFLGASKVLHGAYGYRLRKGFGIDQVKRAYLALKCNPMTRQVVLQIWDPRCDFPDENGNPSSTDIPCNVTSLLNIRDDRLFWTQIMRSNDVMRGLPYDILQFTILQELFASWLGCEMGNYLHISNSLHMYKNCIEKYEICSKSESLVVNNEVEPLNISFEETYCHLSSIYKDLITIPQLKSESCNKKIMSQLDCIFSPDSNNNLDKPPLFLNILCVIGSDAARRLGNDDYAMCLLKRCTNSALRMVAMNWLKRNNK